MVAALRPGIEESRLEVEDVNGSLVFTDEPLVARALPQVNVGTAVPYLPMPNTVANLRQWVFLINALRPGIEYAMVLFLTDGPGARLTLMDSEFSTTSANAVAGLWLNVTATGVMPVAPQSGTAWPDFFLNVTATGEMLPVATSRPTVNFVVTTRGFAPLLETSSPEITLSVVATGLTPLVDMVSVANPAVTLTAVATGLTPPSDVETAAPTLNLSVTATGHEGYLYPLPYLLPGSVK